VKPRLITHFEPWMALSFSEGSIGGDIESVSLAQLEAFYCQQASPAAVALASLETGLEPEPSGSNGFAIAPAITRKRPCAADDQSAYLVLLRPEVQVTSGEGLNAYGAVTWGQFFVYQGFNERVGWMHTSGGGDVIDEYLESIVDKDGAWFYRYDGALRPLKAVPITLPYKRADGTMGAKTITSTTATTAPSCARRMDAGWPCA
jgi:acyl-homoserine-lactone acylase